MYRNSKEFSSFAIELYSYNNLLKLNFSEFYSYLSESARQESEVPRVLCIENAL